ncbi:hypothetical protein AAC387_Pa03g2194 [Persea americana]
MKGMPFGCGSFKLRTGETEIFETTRTFSHQESAVLWTGDRYSFFPWVGEVWAIYKNWSAEWTFTDVKHCEYELVEVLEHDFAVYGVLILEVVDRFRTIYKGTGIEVDIMYNELLRFSHRVPSFHLREERGGNVRAYFVLDPATLPDSKQDKAKEQNVAEQRACEGKQETSMQLNRIFEWPTSPSTRHNCAVSLLDGSFTKSTTSPMALSSEEVKDSQAFAEWAHRGFLEVGCLVEPAELDGVGDEYGRVWVQRCPKLFALFNPSPHYGTIVGVTETYLGLIRSSLWGTFANFVKEVAHFDCAVSNSQLACLTDQMKALQEAGFPVKVLKNRLKALAFQSQQMASATLEALEVAKATAPSTECLEAAMAAEGAAEKQVLAIKRALAEACRKLRAAKAQHQALREQKVAMEKEIEVACQELEAAEENLGRVFQL